MFVQPAKVQQRAPGAIAVIVVSGLEGLRSAEVDKLVELVELARDVGCRTIQVSVPRSEAKAERI